MPGLNTPPRFERNEQTRRLLEYVASEEAWWSLALRLAPRSLDLLATLTTRVRAEHADAPVVLTPCELRRFDRHHTLRRLARDAIAGVDATTAVRLDKTAAASDALRNALVAANLGLIHGAARRFAHPGVDPAELLQEGALGLQIAVERFEPSRGFTLSTYSRAWIMQSIRRFLQDHAATIRVPVHTSEKLAKLDRARDAYARVRGHGDVTAEELGAHARIDAETVETMLSAPRTTATSAETPMHRGGDCGEAVLGDALAGEGESQDDALAREQIAERLDAVIGKLKPVEILVLRMTFGFGQRDPVTLEQTGQRLGVTRERIRQIQATALQKMRRLVHDKNAFR